MRAVKLVFAWSFLITALVACGVSALLGSVRVVVDANPISAALFKAGMLAVLLVPAAVFAVAWWTVLKQKPSARTWAISACAVTAGIPLLVLFDHRHPANHLLWIPVALGTLGCIVFAREGRSGPPSPYASRPGDGTAAILNRLVWVIAAASGIAGVDLSSRWTRSHALPSTQTSFLAMLLVLVLVVAIHEAGHALAGISLGMKLTRFVVGPLQWRRSAEGWKFRLAPVGLLSFLGQTAVVPVSMENYRRRKILQVAAGPLASIASGLVAAAVLFLAPGLARAAHPRALAFFALASLLAGTLNLIPFRVKGGYSDGAQLYQLLSAGLWADYGRLLAMIASTAFTPRRPAEYDIATIQRAAGHIAHGLDELFLHLCAYSYFLDREQFPQAAQAIAKADACSRDHGLNPPADWHSVMVFGMAYVCRDAVAARRWRERLEAQKGFRSGPEFRASQTALLWIEGRLEEARDAWKDADRCTRQLPDSGYAAAERHAVALLRQALDASLPTPAAQFESATT